MASIEFDHMGVVVRDLEATVQFFMDLGFQRDGRAEVSGSWMDRVIGPEGLIVEVAQPLSPAPTGA